jgi:streptogramin lyase
LQAVDGESHRAEPAIEPPVVDGCMGSYGIAIDEQGRVWRGAHPCTGVFRYDPADGSWRRFTVGDNGASLGVTSDGEGHVWAVFFRDENRSPVARVARFDAETGAVDRSWDLEGTIADPWGVGLDGEGDAWIVSRGSDRALEIDGDTGETRAVATGDEPYTYSDFTGYQLDIVTDRHGTVEMVLEGCPEVGETEWFDVTVDAAVPEGARVELQVKSADDAETLAATPWRGPVAPPADARRETGRLLAVRVELWAAEDPRVPLPLLRDVSAAHRCPDLAE